MFKRIAANPLLIFTAAFITRLASAAYIFSRYSSPQLLFTGNEPSHIAAALASGMGFSSPYANVPIAPTAQQPPIYPFILSGIFKLFGTYSTESAWAAVILNILAGATTAILLRYVGKLHFGETVGIVAAWLWVLPWTFRLNTFSVSLTSAPLAALGMGAFLLWVPREIETQRRCLVLGVTAGLLVLLQPALLFVVLAYILWLEMPRLHPRRIVIAAAGLLLVLTPWTIRNYATFGRLIPLRDNFGLELWLGNRPGMSGTVDYSGDFPDLDPTNYARLGELPYMYSKFQIARDFIRHDPAGFFDRARRRSFEFWYRPYSTPWIVVCILGWLGAVWIWSKQRSQWIWPVTLAIFPVVYCVTHNFPTYRHPIEPVVILLAAYCLSEIVDRSR